MMPYLAKCTDGEKIYFFSIKQDNTTKNKWYCAMQNPFRKEYDTKVIYGGSVEIVRRKIDRQFKKFKESAK